MKKKTIGILSALLVLSLTSFAQSKPETKSDTAKVPAEYVTDSVNFKTTTGWVDKITVYQKQFVQQPGISDTASEFVVKKQWTPTSVIYKTKISGVYKNVWVLFEFREPDKK